MAPLQFNTFTTEEGTDYVTFIGPNGPRVAPDGHSNYQEIVRLLRQSKHPSVEVDPLHVDELFDIEGTLSKRFHRLSERVLVRGGKIYFDGDEVESTLTDQVLRFLDEGVDDYQPIVNFWEALASNPLEDSRERSFDWLAAEKFTITPEGDIVGYKSLNRLKDSDPEDPIFESVHSGPAIVDDMEHEGGPVPQGIGSIVEMARGQVTHNPHQDCAYGLHVGTWSYAGSWSGDTTLEVHVNPRDIVSVPHGDGRKMRVCRYTVVGPVTEKYEGCVLSAPEPTPEPVVEPEEEYMTPGEVERVEAVSEPQVDSEPTTVKHPSKAAFEKMLGRAKRRRRNFAKYAAKQGPWTYIGPEDGDEKNRLNWSV